MKTRPEEQSKVPPSNGSSGAASQSPKSKVSRAGLGNEAGQKNGGKRIFGSIQAFTMIEIALCLAIIGFALVAIIGVLPTGLSVQKDNREETIINYEANFLMDAIRSGAQGQDDLTNYVICITNIATTYRINGNVTNVSGNPAFYTFQNDTAPNATDLNGTFVRTNFLSVGSHIVGLLTTPKYIAINGGFISNYISADFRGISGPAVDQGTSQDSKDFAFRYRVEPELVQYGDSYGGATGHDFSWTNLTAPNLTAYEFAWRSNNFLLAANLQANLSELRLRFRWPVLANGKTGTGRQVFRTAVGGSIAKQSVLAKGQNITLWFAQPLGYATTNAAAF